MGVPVKVALEGPTRVSLLQAGALAKRKKNPDKVLRKLAELANATDGKEPQEVTSQGRSMIERIIEYSIRNRFIVIMATLVIVGVGRLRGHQHAGRCDSRPEREPGDRLHRLDGSQPAGN